MAFVMMMKSFPKRSFRFCDRTLSTLHATLAVILASISVQDWKSSLGPRSGEVEDSITRELGCESIASDLRFGVLPVRQESERPQCDSPFDQYYRNQCRPGLSEDDHFCLVDKRIAFEASFSIARMVVGPYLAFKTLSADNPFIIKGLAKNKGYGIGLAADERFLVLQNCQNSEVQAHEENHL
ncbi:hypothetical protein NL676_003716 [Syzygium grande]|nr:hypothetical protein NL676_003716 [Syzygium grande]